MKISLVIILLFSLNVRLFAQADAATIRAAQTTVTSASNSLRPYQKFSDNDSVHWLFGGDASLLFRATTLTNWAQGGEDQIGMSPIANLYYNYKKGKYTLENYATFAYGFLKTGENEAIKNDDRLHYLSKFGYQMMPKMFYTASILLRTQFAAGYRYSKTDTIRINDFWAPAYVFVSAGIDYRPNNSLSFVVSPVKGRATYIGAKFDIEDDLNIFRTAGMTTTQKDEDGNDIIHPLYSRYEFGGGAVISFRGNLLKDRISYNSQIDLFSNYMNNPENIDIVWAFQTKILIYRNISADIRLDMKYDHNQRPLNEDGTLGYPQVQTRSFLGLGLFYQF